jgi:cation transport ATPase
MAELRSRSRIHRASFAAVSATRLSAGVEFVSQRRRERAAVPVRSDSRSLPCRSSRRARSSVETVAALRQGGYRLLILSGDRAAAV